MPSPKRPKMAQNRHISGHTKKTKQFLFRNVWFILLSRQFKEARSDEFPEIGVPFLKFGPLKLFGPLQTPFLDPPMVSGAMTGIFYEVVSFHQ